MDTSDNQQQEQKTASSPEETNNHELNSQAELPLESSETAAEEESSHKILIEVSEPTPVNSLEALESILTKHAIWHDSVVNPTKKITNGRANLNGSNLAGLDLSGVLLSGASLKNCDFRNTNFSSAKLTGCDFEGSQLAGAQFKVAHLRRARFQNCDVSEVDFSEADIRGAFIPQPEKPKEDSSEELTELLESAEPEITELS